MRSITKYLGAILLTLFGFTSSYASASFSVGTDDFYLNVGDYDYLPYSNVAPGRVNFYTVMGEYGSWVSVTPFGRCWRPYVAAGWRPYVNGHWIETQYGQYWQGYEPWAWVGYHYGNWIFSQRYGWVWIPGYDWHAGRVAWARSNDTIGWSPAPPYGCDYSRGYLSYRGAVNQYAYDDPYFDTFNDQYAGPCGDPRFGGLYCNRGYSNVSVNLWVFVDRNHFGYDNYSNFYLGRDYVRNVFDRRLVRIHSRPLRRDVLERVVKQRIREVPVRVREFDTEKRRVKVVVPMGQEDRIRKNGTQTVREVIAPAFAQNHKTFKGLKAKNQKVVSAMFHQDNRKPRVETLNADQVVRVAKERRDRQEKNRTDLVKVKNKELVQIDERIRANERKKNEEVRKSSDRQKVETHKKDTVKKDEKKISPAVRKEVYTNKDIREISRRNSQRSVQVPAIRTEQQKSRKIETSKKVTNLDQENNHSRTSSPKRMVNYERFRQTTVKADKTTEGSRKVVKKEVNQKETAKKSTDRKVTSKKVQKKKPVNRHHH
jgi:hypothetical protein